MHRFRCVVVDHLAGAPLLQQTLALLRERNDIDCEVVPAAAASRARVDLLVICSGAGGRATLLPLVAGCRSLDAPRSLLVVGALDGEQDLRALVTLGVTDFVRLPLSRAEFDVRVDRALGIAACLHDEPAAAWLGDADLMLLSGNARFNAQVARLPRLASAGLDVIVCGAPGTGRRAFARRLACVAGDLMPIVVDAATVDPWLADPPDLHPADSALSRAIDGAPDGLTAGAAAGEGGRMSQAPGTRSLIVHDLERIAPAAQLALCERLRSLRAAGASLRLTATAAADVPLLQARGELVGGLAELLAAHRVRMPALRERPEDIVLLAHAMLRAECARERRPMPGLTPAAIACLLAHDWPDNLFGLRRVLQRSLRPAGTVIGAADLLFDAAAEASMQEQSLQEVKARLVVSFERGFLEQLLEACRGNINMAARMARKNRRSLFELIRKHDIDVDRYRRNGDDLPPRAEEPLAGYGANAA